MADTNNDAPKNEKMGFWAWAHEHTVAAVICLMVTLSFASDVIVALTKPTQVTVYKCPQTDKPAITS